MQQRIQKDEDKMMSSEQIQAAKLAAAKDNQRLWALIEKYGLEKIQASPSGRAFIEKVRQNQFCRNMALTVAAWGKRDPGLTVKIFLPSQRGANRTAGFLAEAARIFKITGVSVSYPFSRRTARRMFQGLSPEQKTELGIGPTVHRTYGQVDEMTIVAEPPRTTMVEFYEWAMYQPPTHPKKAQSPTKESSAGPQVKLAGGTGEELDGLEDLEVGDGDEPDEPIEEITAVTAAAPPNDPLLEDLGGGSPAVTPAGSAPAKPKRTCPNPPAASSPDEAEAKFMELLVTSSNPVALALAKAISSGQLSIAAARQRAAAVNLKL